MDSLETVLSMPLYVNKFEVSYDKSRTVLQLSAANTCFLADLKRPHGATGKSNKTAWLHSLVESFTTGLTGRELITA